ncbi:hypothetical protein J1N35_019213 [Gossypium stocksii]|uniref:Uncharacterized protein n=1 Tax=Gossypium stocksii TaxID=47602 RepID=A0A9D3VQH9_9ROSI|nr:hypothetical protein J1N35_019213 [Gossypium stocksii]
MSSSCHSLFRAILKLPIVVEAFKPHVGSSSTSIEQQLPVDVVVACRQQLEPKAANKCFICRMKVGLTGFKCRVLDDAIAKANPIAKADKVESLSRAQLDLGSMEFFWGDLVIYVVTSVLLGLWDIIEGVV